VSNLEAVVQKFTIENYGDLITTDKPHYRKDTKTWEVQLKSTYPRIIHDEQSNETVIRFLDLRDLGTIKFDEEFHIVDAPSDKSCQEQLASRINLWKKQSEQIVLRASSSAFARIAESIHVLNPLGLILDELAKGKKEKFTIFESEVDEQRRPQKIRQYLELLEELQIVKKVDEGYSYGNAYVGIVEGANNEPHKIKTALISHVIKRKYSTLRQVFGITQLEPYVHLANAYYWPSLDAERLMHTTRPRLFQRYQNYYTKVSTWDFNSRLSELMDQRAIVEENGYLMGDKDRFNHMLEMKHAEVHLNP